MTRFLLANRFPLLLWWGPQYVSIYNDAYRPVLGTKHPWALGQPVRECWKEIWQILQPLIDVPFHGGPATWNDDILLEINRHGFVEETHFTIAYSPVPDETVPGGIGGVLAIVHEITGKMVGDRRVLALRNWRSAEAKTAEEACAISAETLAAHLKDIPFALLYLIGPDRKTARLMGTAGVAAGEPASPAILSLEGAEAADAPWPLAEAMGSEAMQTVTALGKRLGGQVPPGPWTAPPHTAVVVPIYSNKVHWLAGFLVAGISPRLQLDDCYRDFLKLVLSQIATSLANAREYEEEKKLAEALAEVDRAKTAFFSNVSHELRTPMNAILGMIDVALPKSVDPTVQDCLKTAKGSAGLLLTLLNDLSGLGENRVGQTGTQSAPFSLRQMLHQVQQILGFVLATRALTFPIRCLTRLRMRWWAIRTGCSKSCSISPKTP